MTTMTKSDIIAELTLDEKNNNGEILDKTNDYIEYIDYESDITMQYRYQESCTDEYMKSRIFISENIAKKGFTADYIIQILKAAFKDDYFDAICTMSGIIIPSNESEWLDMLQKTIRTSDIISEWYDYTEDCEYLGKMYTTHQIVFINEPKHIEIAKELGDEQYPASNEYEIGMITSLIHEMRHLYLDTNLFVSEDHIPLSENKEENVEEFARTAYENLPYNLKHFLTTKTI